MQQYVVDIQALERNGDALARELQSAKSEAEDLSRDRTRVVEQLQAAQVSQQQSTAYVLLCECACCRLVRAPLFYTCNYLHLLKSVASRHGDHHQPAARWNCGALSDANISCGLQGIRYETERGRDALQREVASLDSQLHIANARLQEAHTEARSLTSRGSVLQNRVEELEQLLEMTRAQQFSQSRAIAGPEASNHVRTLQARHAMLPLYGKGLMPCNIACASHSLACLCCSGCAAACALHMRASSSDICRRMQSWPCAPQCIS